MICGLAAVIVVSGAGGASAGAAGVFTVGPAPIDVGPVTLSNISLNGNGTNTITVAPGQDVRVSADWADHNTGCPGCVDFVSASFAGASAPAGCIENPGFNGRSGSGSVDLGPAPTAPGLYDVDSGFLEQYSCNATGGAVIAQVQVVAPPTAGLTVTKAASPTPTVLHGQDVTYTLTVANAGPDVATGATITDTLPAGQAFVPFNGTDGSGSSPGCVLTSGAGVSPQVVTCPVGDLPADNSTVDASIVAVAGTVGSGQSDSATATSTTTVTTSNTATTSVNVVPAADLTLTKTAAPNPAFAGQQVTYTLVAHNAGPDPALAPTITDVLPAGETFQGASSNCTYDAGTRTVTCTLADLAAGSDSPPVMIVVLAPPGSVTNTASVTSTIGDPFPGNNSGSTITTVNPSCTTTQTTNAPGSIIVHSGQFLCLNNVTVGGAVIVDAGGALTVTNSHIVGGVAANGAQFVTLCGSSIGAAVSIKNTVLLTRVGDDSSGCAPNRIAGGLLLTANKGGLEAYGNTIGGAVSVTGNVGASPLADGIPEVEGNRIAGSLACTANVPSVVNDGLPNTAAAKLGQCAGL